LIREKEKTSKFFTCGELVIGTNAQRERRRKVGWTDKNTQHTTHTHTHNGDARTHTQNTHGEERGGREKEREKKREVQQRLQQISLLLLLE
jgi:hypothetical protein